MAISSASTTPLRFQRLSDGDLASRKAEEAANRRYLAASWLESMAGPLNLSSHPSEEEFRSFLRNGLVLCNTINKIMPGAVPKVVESHGVFLPSEGQQPLPAYQYFENVRNFLVALDELKLPGFEASYLEQGTLEAGSTVKIVDCVLALKSYYEWKQCGGNGSWKYVASMRSPMVENRHLDMFACNKHSMDAPDKPKSSDQNDEHQAHNDLSRLFKQVAKSLFNTKENIDQKFLVSGLCENEDPIKVLAKILSSCQQEQQRNKFPQIDEVLKEIFVEGHNPCASSAPRTADDTSTIETKKGCKSCRGDVYCTHWSLLQTQEKDISELKALCQRARKEFEALQNQWQTDLRQLGNQVRDLSSAAVGYHRVLKENRNLYNELQDLKGNIRVFCRIRPSIRVGNPTQSTIDSIGDDGSLIIVNPLKLQKDSKRTFQFNKVFSPIATQEEVFMNTQPLIRSVMDGYNVCIFAYGQTGSGKTHTMCGRSGGSDTDLGVNYRALNDLFEISRSRRDVVNYKVRVQMVEIYNEQVRDLLGTDASATKYPVYLEIRICPGNNGLSVPDASLHLVQSSVDVINLMNLGQRNRVICSTALNDRSSRSHSVLTVHVQGKDMSGCILRSCLHLVDLAGSERVDKSEVMGDRLKEAQYINKSLSCLGDVIAALAQKNSHVPYRNSKLTQLLQDSLGGHAKALMFAHVSPEIDSYAETISTLKFAERVSTVEIGAARLNKVNGDVHELREQVESLKKALARKEAEMVASSQKMKELRSPIANPKVRNEQSLVRPRRLSIEGPNQGTKEQITKEEDIKGSQSPLKPKAVMEHPPRSRRLSIERPSNIVKNDQPMKQVDSKGSKSPLLKPKLSVEHPLNCSRRVSIEGNNIGLSEQTAKANDTKEPRSLLPKPMSTSECTPTRAQQSSLGDPESGRNEDRIRTPHTAQRCMMNGIAMNEVYSEASEVNSRTAYGKHQETVARSTAERCLQYMAETTRTVVDQDVQLAKLGSGINLQLQLQKTPEQLRQINKDDDNSEKQRETSFIPNYSQTSSNSSRKGSQLRKSFLTIGRLIHGSEKRNHQSMSQTSSPMYSNGPIKGDGRSPTSSSIPVLLKRQSLTGVHSLEFVSSRRSSLGGRSIDSCKLIYAVNFTV
ncbi:hypothetical protein AMTR_s00038p00117280 [Amborella trichopoda]|uniref:Kinesin motor domain-containing protein n=1 Tax=Amborella trichopoda TaxID=13333 RepID=U5CZL8_AMBTC|nr:hypothetical protein AMTR_s00038p00117280 [Amborella trichopoda]